MTLAERLRQGLMARDADAPVLLRGDLREGVIETEAAIAAAVLVAVTDRRDPGVILTRRTDSLRRHAGQIAFPGGRVDPGDDGPVAAALREAHEEIGLSPDRVELIGQADRYRTVTGFEVQPVIGIIPPDLAFIAEPGEVAAVFEAPLAFLLDPANHAEVSMAWEGRVRHYYEISWNGHRIWGATAAMLVNLSRRLRWSA